MTMGVLIKREFSDRWVNRFVIVLLLAIIAIELSSYISRPTDSERAGARVAATIEAWLRELKIGGDGLKFWASGEVVEPLEFYSVRFWQMMHIEPYSHALVRVDSQTDEGEPVSKLWKIYLGMDRDGTRPITRVVAAADESTPSSVLARRHESALSRTAREEKKKVRQENEKVHEEMEHDRREWQEAREMLAGLSRKVQTLEDETKRKLRGLSDSQDRQVQETERRMMEQAEWLDRLAGRIDKSYREFVAGNSHGEGVANVEPRRMLADFGSAAPVRGIPLGLQGRAPTPDVGPQHAFFKRAEELYRAGNYRDAAAVYSGLIETHPDVEAAYLRRGDCYCSLNEFDLALADFAMALRLMPKDPRAHLAQSWAHLAKGATDLAMSDATEALRLDATLAEAHLIRTEIFARKGQPDRARAARFDAVTAFYRRGVASVIKRDYEPAIADLERVIREAPNRVEAHAWCGKAYYLRLDFPNAVKEFSVVIQLDPKNADAYRLRSVAEGRMGRALEATSDLKIAESLAR
jgi:tetratricopeptide (TPR) repeat protein